MTFPLPLALAAVLEEAGSELEGAGGSFGALLEEEEEEEEEEPEGGAEDRGAVSLALPGPEEGEEAEELDEEEGRADGLCELAREAGAEVGPMRLLVDPF